MCVFVFIFMLYNITVNGRNDGQKSPFPSVQIAPECYQLSRKCKGDKAMTNEAIISRMSENLVNAGVLKTVEVGGELIPEPIHTFAGWKALGFSVKKGERSEIKFPIWKHTSKTKKNEEGEEEKSENLFMTTAAFFTAAQVERIKAK